MGDMSGDAMMLLVPQELVDKDNSRSVVGEEDTTAEAEHFQQGVGISSALQQLSEEPSSQEKVPPEVVSKISTPEQVQHDSVASISEAASSSTEPKPKTGAKLPRRVRSTPSRKELRRVCDAFHAALTLSPEEVPNSVSDCSFDDLLRERQGRQGLPHQDQLPDLTSGSILLPTAKQKVFHSRNLNPLAAASSGGADGVDDASSDGSLLDGGLQFTGMYDPTRSDSPSIVSCDGHEGTNADASRQAEHIKRRLLGMKGDLGSPLLEGEVSASLPRTRPSPRTPLGPLASSPSDDDFMLPPPAKPI
ncbi:unnamed protein product [Amoebophrya sp. A25]|nr:unnamed protein product [Amoebophrya sp. A25]|eukprot:GSA25T00013603001.1